MFFSPNPSLPSLNLGPFSLVVFITFDLNTYWVQIFLLLLPLSSILPNDSVHNIVQGQ